VTLLVTGGLGGGPLITGGLTGTSPPPGGPGAVIDPALWFFFGGLGGSVPQAPDLITAVIWTLNGDGDLASLLPGGAFKDVAERGVTFPAATVSLVSESDDFDSSGGGVKEGEVQVSVFAENEPDARAAIKVVRKSLTDPELDIDPDEGAVIYFRPTGGPQTVKPGEGEGSADDWQAVQSFRYLVSFDPAE
jgi:hypothetical protein